ncbi:MAG TPA: DegV family protein [Limnochordales bacterium]
MAVVTDSVACLPPELAEGLGIEVVPIWIRLGDEQLRDGVDITAEQVYRRLRQWQGRAVAVSTSAPSPGDFLQAFRRAAQRGASAVVAVTVAAPLSASWRSAGVAAASSPIPVTVVDSRTAAAAQGWVAVEAARVARAGGTVQEVVSRIEAVRPLCRAYALVPDLRYLRRGGRVVHALARLGAALGVVPVLAIHPGARIEPMAVATSVEGALERIVAELMADARRGRLHVTVMEADAGPLADRLEREIAAAASPAELWRAPFTPAMGLHAGPGVVGVGYWLEPHPGEAVRARPGPAG